jgi:hypothetical protein
LPDIECALNPNTLLAATSRGGHVAFLQGLWPFGTAFMGEDGEKRVEGEERGGHRVFAGRMWRVIVLRVA